MHRQTQRVKIGLMTELESDEETVKGKLSSSQKMQSSNDQHIYCQSQQITVAPKSIQTLKPNLQMHESLKYNITK